MSTGTDAPEVEAAKVTLFAEALEDFVARRDAIVRDLRAEGKRDEAAAVKALRKPSRTAWALDAAFHAGAGHIEQVAAAVNQVVEAQDGRGDMRDATRALRDAVQGAARAAADAAAAAGHPVDRANLVPALLGVVGDPTAFGLLRKGQLADLPVGGDLDVLTNPPPLLAVSLPAAGAGAGAAAALPDEPPPPVDLAARRKARATVDKATEAATSAHDDLTAAEQAVDDAKTAFDVAEATLHQAETDARDARTALNEAQRASRAAAQQARQADRDLAAARRAHPET
jgi:hypothetical protein